MSKATKKERLQQLALRAGDLLNKSYLGGNRERAYHFLRKMNAILKMIQQTYKGVA